MHHRLSFLLLTALFLVPFAHAVPSYITFPSDVDWVERESPHFHIIYRRGSDTFAKRALVAAERAYAVLTPIFPEVPDRTHIVLADFQDSLNGYALTFPYPHMVIFAAPPDAGGELSSLDEWYESVILHEFVHILHVYPASGLWSLGRTIFGSWVVPNGLLPNHFHEGLAVLMETEKTAGGRGRSAVFKMYKRVAVAEGVWGFDEFSTLDRMDGTLTRYPHGTSAYFFGYYLNRELLKRKGEKGIYRLVQSESDNWPLLLNLPAEDVYGKSYSQLWDEIYKGLETEAKGEIEAIRKKPLSKLDYLTHTRYTKRDVAYSPDGKQIAYRRWTPEDGSAIEIRDVAKNTLEKKIEMSGGGEGLCFFKDGMLWNETTGANLYVLRGLTLYDFKDDSQRKLSYNDKELTHVQRLSCLPTGDRIGVYEEWKGDGFYREYTLTREKNKPVLKLVRDWKIPESTWISGILIDPKGVLVALRAGLQTHFYRWNTGADKPTKVFQTKGHFFNFRATNKSSEILAITAIDERDEIWSLNLLKGEAHKRVALLGGVNGFDVFDDKFVVTSYRHGGYDVAKAEALASASVPLASDDTEVKERGVSETKISEQSEYSALSTILPRAWVPMTLFVPDGMQFAAWIPGFDLSQKHVYDIIGGYDTRGLPFADGAYNYRFAEKFSVGTSLYYLPSYYLPERAFFQRWGGSVSLGTSFSLLPEALGLGSITTGVSVGPTFTRQEALGSRRANQSVGVQISLSHRRNFKRRPISITPISGTGFGLSYAQYFQGMGSTDNYFSTVASFDQYFEAPWWREHGFYIGARLGWTDGTAIQNAYFLSGGELLFSQISGAFLNRGFFYGTFAASKIFNTNVEYRFPIARIERGLGLLPLHLKNLHFALTWDVSTIDYTVSPFRAKREDFFQIYYTSVGGELRSNWTLGYYVPTTIRIGAYHGFGPFGEPIYVTMGIEAQL